MVQPTLQRLSKEEAGAKVNEVYIPVVERELILFPFRTARAARVQRLHPPWCSRGTLPPCSRQPFSSPPLVTRTVTRHLTKEKG